MRPLFLGALIFTLFFSQSSGAQDKNGIIDEHNKKSSSFVVDPDPLDPLPVKKENIKDGDEIILDDIRQVIESNTPVSAETNGESKSAPSKTQNSRAKIKSKARSKTSSSRKARSSMNLYSDEPDLRIENRFHRTYEKFDINPTSVEQWSKASGGQKENIYVVQKNDNLFTISKTLFGDSKFWPKIWALNRMSILNPHQIVPGMKIHFFAGDSESAPTLSFNSHGDIENGEDDESSTRTEFETKKLRPHKRLSGDPAPIPDSLPASRNYGTDDNRTQIDLKVFSYVDESPYTNPYILSSTELKSDIGVPDDQIPHLICKDNQFIPQVTKINVNTGSGKFLIVQKLFKDKSRLKATYKYKTIGSVVVNEQNQMRVSDCKQLMDIDTLIVSEEKLNSLSEPDEKFEFSSRILDGLDYQSQDYYMDNQYLVINIEGLNVDNGANLGVFSEALGKKVGQIRILRRTGTMAIAVVTHVYDTISRGDKIVE